MSYVRFFNGSVHVLGIEPTKIYVDIYGNIRIWFGA